MPYDYSLELMGPTHVARGYELYLFLDMAVLSGTRDYVDFTVTGLPSGVTVTFPYLESICCGPLKAYGPQPVHARLAASGSATLGVFTLTITALSAGVTHADTIDITVEPAPSALGFTPISSFTAIPSLSAWEADMLSYGGTHCANLQGVVLTAEQKLEATYYDAERVFYQIADYTSDPAWVTCAGAAEAAYRDYYVIPNGGSVTGFWNFTKGMRLDYEHSGDTTSYNTVVLMSENAAYTTGAFDTVIPTAYSREVAYATLAFINAEKIGYTRNSQLESYIDLMLGHFDQWFVSVNARCLSGCTPAAVGDYYIQPFMIGLILDALIDYYDEITHDPRIPVIVKTAVDWLWEHAWYAPGGMFWYENYIADPSTIPSGYWTPPVTPTTSVDLNLLIAPAFAWLYRMTGDTTYRDNGDTIFAGGVAGAFISGAKQFNQNYKWSFDYVEWRSGGGVGFPSGSSAYPWFFMLL